MEHQRNQPPSAVPVPCRKGLTEALAAASSLSESQQAGRMEKQERSKHSNRALQWLPVDLGEHPPLEGLFRKG